MEIKKWIKNGLIVLFVVVAGLFYSCSRTEEQDAKIELQSQEAFTDTLEDQEEYEDSNANSNTNSITVNEDLSETDSKDFQSQEASDTLEAKSIYVYICGQVKKPDVYEVEENARVVDVINLAGGLTEAADGNYINQAAKVSDGQKIYIPSKEETKDIVFTEDEALSSTLSEASQSDSVKDTSNSTGQKTEAKDKININTASKEELMELAGIGEAKAEDILAYRQTNGSFQSIEEIKNIKGIKDSVFNKIKDEITVN